MVTITMHDGSREQCQLYEDVRGMLRLRALGCDFDLLGTLRHTGLACGRSGPRGHAATRRFRAVGREGAVTKRARERSENIDQFVTRPVRGSDRHVSVLGVPAIREPLVDEDDGFLPGYPRDPSPIDDR